MNQDPIQRALKMALLDFAEIVEKSKPNCGLKLRKLIQDAQIKHSEIIQEVKNEQ
jgi:hypothetical protein